MLVRSNLSAQATSRLQILRVSCGWRYRHDRLLITLHHAQQDYLYYQQSAANSTAFIMWVWTLPVPPRSNTTYRFRALKYSSMASPPAPQQDYGTSTARRWHTSKASWRWRQQWKWRKLSFTHPIYKQSATCDIYDGVVLNKVVVSRLSWKSWEHSHR